MVQSTISPVLDRIDAVQEQVRDIDGKIDEVERSLNRRIDALGDSIDENIDGLVERLVRVETSLDNLQSNRDQATQDTSAHTAREPVADDQ